MAPLSIARVYSYQSLALELRHLTVIRNQLGKFSTKEAICRVDGPSPAKILVIASQTSMVLESEKVSFALPTAFTILYFINHNIYHSFNPCLTMFRWLLNWALRCTLSWLFLVFTWVSWCQKNIWFGSFMEHKMGILYLSPHALAYDNPFKLVESFGNPLKVLLVWPLSNNLITLPTKLNSSRTWDRRF